MRGRSRQSSPASGKSDRALDLLNFFVADLNGAFGPYLGIFLLTEAGWNQAAIGFVAMIGGLATLAAQTPVGAFIDTTRRKRGMIVLAALVLAIGAVAVALQPNATLVTLASVLMALAGTVFPPAVVAITRGIAKPSGLVRRLGRNAAFDHAGNVTIALTAAAIGTMISQRAVFFLVPICAALASASVLAVPRAAIDHAQARGLEDGATAAHAKPSSLRALLACPGLAIFACCVALFHFANAPMLPLVGQKLALDHKSEATALMSACVIAAQLVMLPMAIIVGRTADRIGRKPVCLAAFAILPIRGVLYTLSNDPFWLVGVQILDGVGAGLFGALTPIFLADMTRGTGHYNLSQGVIATIQGGVVAVSGWLAGLLVVWAGYGAAFLALAAIACLALFVLLLGLPETRPNAGELPVSAPAGEPGSIDIRASGT
ncbi:MAG TPA: MFS transporter [Stellaceae bacterium]